MSNRALRGGARAAVGLLIVAVSATAVVLLSAVPLPAVSREPLAVTVDTTQNTDRRVVCAGAFAELGADPARPTAAVPTGAPAVTLAGSAAETGSLARPEGGEPPAVFSAPTSSPLGAAQLQSVETANLRGTVASACVEPLNEQWLLGGGSSLGVSTTLSLGNPGRVPATVQVTVFDENGEVDAVQTAGVLVPPGTEQTVSLNGYAPDRERLAVRVVSTGAPVAASLGVGQTNGIEPFAVSSVTRQIEPATELVVPGVANVSTEKRGPTDSGEGDAYRVLVRVLAPGGETGTARVRAIGQDGRVTDLGAVELSGGGIAELAVDAWPARAHAAVIESDVPVVGAVQGSAHDGDRHDYDWFAPAATLEPGTPVAAPVVSGGRLVLANAGDEDAVVRVSRAGREGGDREVSVPAGGSTVVRAAADTIVETSAPIAAGVRVVGDGVIAGYPIPPADARDGELTVFAR